MKRINYKWLSTLLVMVLSTSMVVAQSNLSAVEIVKKADDKNRGLTSKATLKMTIVRPTWTREIQMKSWSKGSDYSLTLITAPARDKGAAFLKRDKEIWNWQPTIDRVIKMPPSMMMQSWMGSDFKNDDLVRESSIVEDYTHELVGEEEIEGRACYVIEMVPKDDAPVVWGKVTSWIDKAEFIQLKTEFYDEDDYLVNTMLGKAIKELDGKLFPSILEVVPADEDGHKTMVEYISLEFDKPIKESFFSVQNMKRIR